MGDELVTKSAKVVAMTSSDWQSKLDKEDASQNPDDNLFRWDGKVIPNEKILGSWQTVSLVATLEDFNPEKPRDANRARIKQVTFKSDGNTDEPIKVWSGDTLMDLEKYQALKMKIVTIDGGEYLLVEEGEFSTRHKPDWKSKWIILKRKS